MTARVSISAGAKIYEPKIRALRPLVAAEGRGGTTILYYWTAKVTGALSLPPMTIVSGTALDGVTKSGTRKLI
jgi:hypothetical protein